MRKKTSATRDETLFALLSTVYTPTEILQWITCPHSQLNGETPERLLARGKYHEVRNIALSLSAIDSARRQA
jgi:hypothetical protein